MNFNTEINYNYNLQTLLRNNYRSRTWVEVNKAAILHNVNQLKTIIGSQSQLAIVAKSNAYGHGLNVISQICQESNDVNWLCVFSLSEGLIARENGFNKNILVLGHADIDIEYAILYSIDLVAYDYEQILKLNSIAQKLKQPIYVHLKIDTGLSRLGIRFDKFKEFIKMVLPLAYVKIRGIFSHFSESDSVDQSYTKRQYARFNQILSVLKKLEVNIPIVHCSNTTGIIRFSYCHFNMVRSGGGTYGLFKSPEIDNLGEKKYLINLKPAFYWKSKIIQIKDLPIGSYVSYSRTYVTFRDTKMAIVPVGYWDGYSRQLSNKGFVYIKNLKAPIMGRVCMNMIIIDVTDIQGVKVDDEVTLIGCQPGITPNDLATLSGSINYEITTRVNPNIERVII